MSRRENKRRPPKGTGRRSSEALASFARTVCPRGKGFKGSQSSILGAPKTTSPFSTVPFHSNSFVPDLEAERSWPCSCWTRSTPCEPIRREPDAKVRFLSWHCKTHYGLVELERSRPQCIDLYRKERASTRLIQFSASNQSCHCIGTSCKSLRISGM